VGKQAGFTLLEMAVATLVLLVGGAGVVQMLGSMGTAATFQRAKTRTVDRAQDLVDALSIDLSQSAADIDPADTTQRLVILDSGRTVQFQRVFGIESSTAGELKPAWTESTTVSWDPATGVVTRRVGTGAVESIARGITAFEARSLPDGLVLIRVVAENEVRGETVRHEARVHIKTRN
jgi:prepilin-type N-terminal cleavage/methylation domain-containing protein